MRITLCNFGSFLCFVGHIFYHCGNHKSDKQDFYSVIQTLIKMLINTDQRRNLWPFSTACPPHLPLWALSNYSWSPLTYPNSNLAHTSPILSRKIVGESLLDVMLKLMHATYLYLWKAENKNIKHCFFQTGPYELSLN